MLDSTKTPTNSLKSMNQLLDVSMLFYFLTTNIKWSSQNVNNTNMHSLNVLIYCGLHAFLLEYLYYIEPDNDMNSVMILDKQSNNFLYIWNCYHPYLNVISIS
jgi:hypothetical protein